MERSFQYIQETSDIISFDQFYKIRAARRKRLAKRMAIRFPLFAVQFVSEEFPQYTHEEFEKDLQGKKFPKFKAGKSQLKRQGRYPLMSRALTNYHVTKDQKYLEEAQILRNKLFSRYEVVFMVEGERIYLTFPSTQSVQFVESFMSLKYSSRDELEALIKEKMKYSNTN